MSSSKTKNQTLVFDVLSKASGPLSAYAILDILRDDGMRAPLQVYRALDALIASGEVHRLESMNAFVACTHPECSSHASTAFTICEKCNAVSELNDDALNNYLKDICTKREFTFAKSTVELRGICKLCL